MKVGVVEEVAVEVEGELAIEFPALVLAPLAVDHVNELAISYHPFAI